MSSLSRDDAAAFAPPPAFGPYRVLHQIGVGALGPVFRTYEPTRDRLVAVKVFRLDVPPEQAHALADALSTAAAAGLFHPSIVEPLGAGVQETVAYRAEEYVAAESLDVAIRHYAPAPLDKSLPFITQLAGAIDFARAANVGHGALHLRDIFVTPDEARAGGFGVVDALEQVGLRAPVRRPYSAPERIAGEPWGTPADVFSLAAVAYELVTGRRASGTGEQIGPLGEDVAGPHAAAVRAVLARAMDDEPARRFPTALAFASALETAGRSGRSGDLVLVPAADALRPEPDEAPVPIVPAAPIVAPAGAARAPDRTGEPSAMLEFEPEVLHDDVAVERHDDLANAELHPAMADPVARLLVEREPEAAADMALVDDRDEPPAPVAAAPARRPVMFPEPTLPRERDVLGSYAGAAAVHAPLAESQARRSTSLVPIAAALVAGVALGFAAGRLSVTRETPPAATATAADTPAAASAPKPVASSGREGKAWSEQAVGAASGPPPVPGDAPAPERRPAPSSISEGRLMIRSTPSRANVTLNNQWKGRTPLTLDGLALGAYEVRVVQPGFSTAHEDVTLSAASPARTMTFRLQPAPAARGSKPTATTPLTGSITVDSRPRGAKVFVDGRLVGTTPARVPEIAIGSHVVRLELNDHRAWTTSTRVVAGQSVHVAGSLERIQ